MNVGCYIEKYGGKYWKKFIVQYTDKYVCKNPDKYLDKQVCKNPDKSKHMHKITLNAQD